jgi:hypothetical protein
VSNLTDFRQRYANLIDPNIAKAMAAKPAAQDTTLEPAPSIDDVGSYPTTLPKPPSFAPNGNPFPRVPGLPEEGDDARTTYADKGLGLFNPLSMGIGLLNAPHDIYNWAAQTQDHVSNGKMFDLSHPDGVRDAAGYGMQGATGAMMAAAPFSMAGHETAGAARALEVPRELPRLDMESPVSFLHEPQPKTINPAWDRGDEFVYNKMEKDPRNDSRRIGANDRVDGLYSNPSDSRTAAGISAYHVSPHDFDKFDMSKVGSGIGSGTEGYGLYFTDSEKLTKAYGNDMQSPHKYQVNINADPSKFLDWDYLPESAQQFLSTPDGAKAMKDKGFAGIKVNNNGPGYEGTANYTLFDDALATIEHKWKGDKQLYANPSDSKTTALASALSQTDPVLAALKARKQNQQSPNDTAQ